MKAWVPLLLAYGALACDQAMAQIDEPDIDADCHKVASYAELGKMPISVAITRELPIFSAIRPPGVSSAVWTARQRPLLITT